MRHHQVPAGRKGVAEPLGDPAQRRLVREIVEDLGADDEVETGGQRIDLQVEAPEGDVGKRPAALGGAREGAVGDVGGGQAANPRREQAREVALRAGQLQRRVDRSRGQQVEGAAVLADLVGRAVVPRIGGGEDRLPVGAAVGALRGRIGLRRTRDGRRARGRSQPPRRRGGGWRRGPGRRSPGPAAGRRLPRWPWPAHSFAWARSPRLEAATARWRQPSRDGMQRRRVPLPVRRGPKPAAVGPHRRATARPPPAPPRRGRRPRARRAARAAAPAPCPGHAARRTGASAPCPRLAGVAAARDAAAPPARR